MAEEIRNWKVDDEMMAQATGGTIEPITPYKVGDRVYAKGDEGELHGVILQVNIHDEHMYLVSYTVQFDNGVTYKEIPHFALKLES